MQNLVNVPKTSQLFLPVGHKIPSNEKLEVHNSVIIASLTNNEKIMDLQGDEYFDLKWTFESHCLNEDFDDGFLQTRLVEFPQKQILNLTRLRTSKLVNSSETVLICVLALQLNNNPINPFRQLLEIVNLSVGFSLKSIPTFFKYDSLIQQIKQQNKFFWKKNGPDPKTYTELYMGRRFRTQDYLETEDAEIITELLQKKNDVDVYNFDSAIAGGFDGLLATSDGNGNPTLIADAKHRLRGSMGIEPLPIDQYELYMTYIEIENLFSLIKVFDDHLKIKIDLFIIFLKSYHCCHLVFKNLVIMRQFYQLNEIIYKKYGDVSAFLLATQINKSFIWGIYTLYAEEVLLGSKLTNDHRCVWNLRHASYTPVYEYGNNYGNPYLCLPIAPKILNLQTNLVGAGITECYYGIRSISEIYKNLASYTNGIFTGLKEDNVFLTGSGAEACYYRNSLFADKEVNFKMEQIYPIKNEAEPNQCHSDIDLVVFTDDPDVLYQKMLSVKECLEENIRWEVTVEAVGKKKFRFSGKHLSREIDLFMSHKAAPALLFNYHMSTCRAIIPLNGQTENAMIMSSALISAHLGFCIDRRWFSSKTSLYDRICRQISRGIGMILNCHELSLLGKYIKLNPKWDYLKGLIRSKDGEIQAKHLTYDCELYGRPSTHNVGSFFLTPSDRGYNHKNTNFETISFDIDLFDYRTDSPDKTKFIRNDDGSFVNEIF